MTTAEGQHALFLKAVEWPFFHLPPVSLTPSQSSSTFDEGQRSSNSGTIFPC